MSVLWARGVATVALALSSGACASRQAPLPTPATAAPPAVATEAATPATTDDALGAAFERRFAAAEAGALWSVRLERLGTRTVLASRNAQRLVLPASNLKIATLAAAAVRLGWDYRFETTLHAAGRRVAHVLQGDLVVVGGADPTIGRGVEPLAVFREWARQLRAQGIQRVEGDLVGDPTRFGQEWLGDSWSWNDLPYAYAAPYSGLVFHENVVRIRVAPGAAAGGPARAHAWPVSDGVDLQTDVQTSAATPASVQVTRALGSSSVQVRGSVPVGSPSVERLVTVPDPARYFLGALRAALAEEGVEVRGETRVTAVDDASIGPPVLVHQSPPLAEVAQRFMKVSQNLYGEIFLRVLAARESTVPTGTADARTALQSALAELGVPTGAVQGLDGSGLSRRDFMTAEAVTQLLQTMALPPHRERFRATLPVAAVDGTLANRFKGSPCAGRLLAKTGTLAHARALSGYVTSASGDEYVFSVIANNFLMPPAQIDAIVEDALALVCAR